MFKLSKLWTPYYVFMSEEEFNKMNINIEPFYYDPEEISKMTKRFKVDCHKCKAVNIPTETEITAISDRCIQIDASGFCDKCAVNTFDSIRLRDGYIMKKIADKWILSFLHEPFLLRTFKKIKGWI